MKIEINTRDYGKIEVDETAIIRFDDGIIGFSGYRDYVLLNDGADQSPFRCLQSIDESGLAFIVLDPCSVRPDYEISIDENLTELLSIKDADISDVVVLSIAVVPDDVKNMSVNLKAPIIINAASRRGAQYIVDGADYGVRHLISDEAERARRLSLYDVQKAV